MNNPLGLTCDIHIGFSPKLPVINQLNLDLHPGQLVGVIGPNGSGKSTLLQTLCGFIKPLAGGIQWQGEPLHQSIQHAARHISWMGPCEWGEFSFSTQDIVSMGAYSPTGKIRPTQHTLINHWMNYFDLKALAALPFVSLSDGQKQRAMLARTFVQDTPIIALDEPFERLDINHIQKLTKALQSLKTQGKLIFISAHGIDYLLKLVDYCLVLKPHNLVYQGPAKHLSRAQLAEAFDCLESDLVSV